MLGSVTQAIFSVENRTKSGQGNFSKLLRGIQDKDYQFMK